MSCNKETKPWERVIREVQNEVGLLDGHPYYLEEYRDAEGQRWEHIPEWIYNDMEAIKPDRCLDIGCAYGTLAVYFKKVLQCEIYCTDYLKYISDALIQKQNLIFTVNNIELDAFPWPDLKFDMITFTEVMEHLNFHPIPTLIKIRDLLSDNGRLYLSTPDSSVVGRVTKYYGNYNDIPYPQKGLPVIDAHIYVYDKDELLDILQKAGLKVVRFDYASPYKEHFNLTLEKQ